jgi:hypothetical protein
VSTAPLLGGVRRLPNRLERSESCPPLSPQITGVKHGRTLPIPGTSAVPVIVQEVGIGNRVCVTARPIFMFMDCDAEVSESLTRACGRRRREAIDVEAGEYDVVYDDSGLVYESTVVCETDSG